MTRNCPECGCHFAANDPAAYLNHLILEARIKAKERELWR